MFKKFCWRNTSTLSYIIPRMIENARWRLLRHDLWAKWGDDTRRLAARERHPVLVLEALANDPIVVPFGRGARPARLPRP